LLRRTTRWRLAGNLNRIGDIVDDSATLPDAEEATLIVVQEAVENGVEIEVVACDDEADAEPSDAPEDGGKEEQPEVPVEKPKKTGSKKTGSKKSKTSVGKSKKAENSTVEKAEDVKTRKNSGPVRGEVVGINSLKNRLFCAGVVLKEHGLAIGITEESVKLVDSLCVENGGQSNLNASRNQLSYAWHVVNGFTSLEV
jgi:hypothetical protein